jgi:hypothetical protein
MTSEVTHPVCFRYQIDIVVTINIHNDKEYIMDRNESYNDSDIDTREFYYIGDSFGFPLCMKGFKDKLSAQKHYQKSMKKVSYDVFICQHKVTVHEKIEV